MENWSPLPGSSRSCQSASVGWNSDLELEPQAKEKDTRGWGGTEWGGVGCERRNCFQRVCGGYFLRGLRVATDFLIGPGFHISICFLDMVTYKALKIFMLALTGLLSG